MPLEEDRDFVVFFRADHGRVPTGARLEGDFVSEVRDRILRLTAPDDRVTIHLVTDVRYEEGYTYVSFLHGVPA